MKLSIKNIKLYLYFIIFLIFYYYSSVSGVTIYTPNGCPVSASTPSEGTQQQINDWNTEGDNYVTEHSLDATRIGNSSATYNCHAYAWHISEGGSTVWINSPEEDKYWSDGSYGNGVESYVVVPEAYATKISYVGSDHSATQTNYDSQNPSNSTYVSKWGTLGLYQHKKGQDPYSESGYNFYHAKYTHSGTISSNETWINAKH